MNMSETGTTLRDGVYEPESLLDDGAVTVSDAVAWSGMGRTRLYDAMASGDLPFVQKGRRRLIPRKALRQLLADSLVGGRRESLES